MNAFPRMFRRLPKRTIRGKNIDEQACFLFACLSVQGKVLARKLVLRSISIGVERV